MKQKIFAKFTPNSRLVRLLVVITMIGAMIVLAFLSGYYAREIFASEYFQFPILRQAYQLIARDGLHPLPDHQIIEYEMIRGLIKAYGDPYTSFAEPPQAELDSNQLEGIFGGIGIRIEKMSNGDVLIYPLPESSALTAGIQDGDILIQVDTLIISTDTTMEEIQAAIRGPIGSKVKLVVLRSPELARSEYQVEREEVAIPSVTYHLAPFDSTVGIVQLNLVAATSSTEIEAAFDDLRQKGASRFVLDLRNNTGGLVDAGVDIVNLFLDEEQVIVHEEFTNAKTRDLSVDGNGTLLDQPLVVVVNQNTASASEMIASALQLTGRAKLVGNRTFGKDSVQLVYELRDGSSLHLTSGRWWVPGNENGISANGLSLDVVISDDEANHAQALEIAASLFP